MGAGKEEMGGTRFKSYRPKGLVVVAEAIHAETSVEPRDQMDRCVY